jgi:hypothetical protein
MNTIHTKKGDRFIFQKRGQIYFPGTRAEKGTDLFLISKKGDRFILQKNKSVPFSGLDGKIAKINLSPFLIYNVGAAPSPRINASFRR